MADSVHQEMMGFVAPVVITPVKPAELHQAWDFLERGLEDIRRKVKPDWRSPDVFGAIRAEWATACIVSRGHRYLGFIVWHKQQRGWSGIMDVFLWAGWALPLRERLPGDGIAEAHWRVREYLYAVKQAIGAQKIIAVSSRKGLVKKYGFKELFFTLEM